MGLLKVIDDAPGYLKATFQGPQGSGKTRTAVELACFTHKLFGSKNPVAFFDTETGSDYIAKLIEERTGMKPLRIKTRAFADLIDVTNECVNGASDVLVCDSITHVWRELQSSYVARMNQNRSRPKTRMDISDIMAIKNLWEPWPDLFLQCPIHLIVCGREGNEWGSEENEETGKRDLVTTGKKMKVEGEFGYEASLMVSMAIRQEAEGVVKKRGGQKERRTRSLVNVATIIKDRFDAINGETFDYPTGESFLPHLKLLHPEMHVPTDLSRTSTATLPELGDDGWPREKKARLELSEEIQGEMVKHYPGQTTVEKAAKLDLLDKTFGTRSWSKVCDMPSETLRRGLGAMRESLNATLAA